MEQLVVIKWGGSLAEGVGSPSAGTAGAPPSPCPGVADLARGVRDLIASGSRVAIVHGGGADITRLAARLGLETRFVAGQRVTDGPTLEAVIAALAGTVSTRLVGCLVHEGVPAVGLSGVDGGLLQAEHDSVAGLGLVGGIRQVDARPLTALFEAGLVPVVAPLALGPTGPLNTNADLAAAALAGALSAALLLLLTDTRGVIVHGVLRRRLALGEVDALVASGEVRGGMIPKLEACRRALVAGTQRVRILPGDAAAQLALVVNGSAPDDLCGTVVERGEGGETHVA